MDKFCSKCHLTKPTSQFYKNRAHADGFATWCKPCDNAARYSGTRREQHLAYTVARQKTPEGKAILRAAMSRYNQTAKGRLSQERRRHRYPERVAARDMVNRMILQGRFPSPYALPCAECGNPATEYHHFAGYEEEHWFDVDAVCKPCHVRLSKR